MKIKKILFYIVVILMLLATIMGGKAQDLTTDNVLYHSLDNTNLSGSDPLDISGNGNDGTNNGAETNITGLINEGFNMSTGSDYVNVSSDSSLDFGTGSFSVSIWFYGVLSSSNADWIFTKYAGGGTQTGFRCYTNTYPTWTCQTAKSGAIETTNFVGNVSATEWNNLVFIRNSTGNKQMIYLNGVLKNQTTITNRDVTNSEFFSYGSLEGSNPTNNEFDEIGVWNRSLNDGGCSVGSTCGGEISELYNSGVGFNPYAPAINITVNESTENLIVAKQVGSVNVFGLPTIVEDISFNITNNDTSIYFTHTFEIEKNAGLSGDLFCELVLDGSQIANLTRIANVGESGNIYFVSENVSLDSGNHTEQVICNRVTGSGSINIRKGICMGHIMEDQNNNNINFNFYKNLNLNLTTSYNLIINETFEIDNVTLDSDHTNDVVLDYNYEFNHTTASNITIILGGNNTNCSKRSRISSSGQGIGGGICLLKSVTPNTNMSIKVYGISNVNATGAITSFNIFAKQFIQDIQESVFYNFSEVSVNSTTLLKLLNVSIKNEDHDSVDLFIGSGFDVRENNGISADPTFQLRISDTQTLTAPEYIRTLGLSEIGNIVLTDALVDASKSTFNMTLYGSCDTTNCTIGNGELVGYFANIRTVIFNSFNVTVTDNYDNTTINNITVFLGIGSSFITNNGTVRVFSSNELENLTIINTQNQYFNVTIINHNVSQDLNISLNQTLVRWNCIEKVSGNDLNCSQPLETDVFNYNVAGNPHTQSVNVSGYFETIVNFNVTALQNNTINVTKYSTNLTIRSTSFNGSAVTSCIYNITSLNVSYNESISGLPNSSTGLINGTYSVLADCVGYALSLQNITIFNISQILDFELFSTNSINFTFYNTQNPAVLLTGVNISLALIDGGATNYSTNTGWIYIDNLLPTNYEARYSAENFNDNNYFFTVTNRSTQQISLYLTPSNLTTLFKIIVKDQNDDEVVGATVRLQEQIISLGGQFVTISECSTNDDGECFLNIVESTSIVYRFIILIDGVTVRTTEPAPIITLSTDLKIITIRIQTGANLIEPLQQELGILATLDINNNLSTYNFIDSFNAIVGGCLRISRRNIPSATYTPVTSSCILGQSGTININYTNLIQSNTELKFDGIVNYTNSNVIMVTKSESYIDYGVNRSENDGLFITLLAFLLISFAMVFVQNIYVQIIVDFSIVLGIVILGLNILGIPLVMTFLALGIFISWDRKSSTGVG